MKPPLIATLLCFALPVLATYGYGQSCNPSAQFVTANDTIYQGTVPAGTKYQTNYNEPVTAVYGTSTIYNGQAGTCNGGGTFNVILPSTGQIGCINNSSPCFACNIDLYSVNPSSAEVQGNLITVTVSVDNEIQSGGGCAPVGGPQTSFTYTCSCNGTCSSTTCYNGAGCCSGYGCSTYSGSGTCGTGCNGNPANCTDPNNPMCLSNGSCGSSCNGNDGLCPGQQYCATCNNECENLGNENQPCVCGLSNECSGSLTCIQNTCYDCNNDCNVTTSPGYCPCTDAGECG